jgi:hypothetical protein
VSVPALEHVSPELALVDPDLAKLARQDRRTYGPPAWHSPPRVPPTVAPPPGKRLLNGRSYEAVAVILCVGVVAAFVGQHLRAARTDLSRRAVPSVPQSPATTTPLAAPPSQPAMRPPAPAQAAATRSAAEPTTATRPHQPESATDARLGHVVERQILRLLPAQAGRLVPKTLVDPRSPGLLRANVAVACRSTRAAQTFACVVFSPTGEPAARISAHRLADGRLSLSRSAT